MACKDPDCPICHPKPKMPAPAAPPPAAPLFQVQLQLLADGRPAAGLSYSCYLSDGTRAAGTTDGQGLSGAIVTRTEASVLRIGVSAPSKSSSAACCSAPEAWWQDERLYVGGDGNALAKTVLSATPPVVPISLPNGKERPLTRGEEAMARTVFGDGIDYSKIKIHHGGWWVFAGNQDPDTAVTPNSKIYMPSAIYRDDYSAEHAADRRLFMHELVHVWQFQMGYNVKLNALRVTSQGQSAYTYQLTPRSRLADFNMEQQGNIMSDYYMICIEHNPRDAYNPGMPSMYLHQVMMPFVDPRSPAHLPTK